MEIKRGIGVSEGIVIAPVHVLEQSKYPVTRRRIRIDEVDAEVLKLEQAKTVSERELLDIKRAIEAKSDSEHISMIFEGHIAILNDALLFDEISNKIQSNLFTAEFAVIRIFRKYKRILMDMEDPTFRTKAADFTDIERRLLKNLIGNAQAQSFDTPGILAAHELTPSQTAGLDREKILGVLTEVGGSTSHSAILANALGIPAVVGVEGVLAELETNDTVILDGRRGSVIIEPDEQTIERYTKRKEVESLERIRLVEEVSQYVAETFDGEKIQMLANIEFDNEIERALEYGAQGVGLFRTEFIFSLTGSQPSEEDHYRVYKRSLSYLGSDKTFTIRTMDFGADKYSGELLVGQEANPFLGLRSIRLSLDPRFVHLFRAQLRAILRVSLRGNVKVMFPMISSLNELHRVKGILEEVKDELRQERIDFNEHLPIGVMIEVPSAALVADQLAKEVEFFSIGSNDLVQYTIAVDRNNGRVAHLFEQDHPAVLYLLKKTIDAAKKAEIECSLCGEMAGNTRFTEFLLGLGLRTFSMSAVSIPQVKRTLRNMRADESRTKVENYFKENFEI